MPVIGCFHARYSYQRKRHTFLQVVWNAGLHLRLITGCAVMSEDQVVAVNGIMVIMAGPLAGFVAAMRTLPLAVKV